jgi:hypothetical protein
VYFLINGWILLHKEVLGCSSFLLLPLRSYFVEEGALSRKRREEKIRKDHIKALDKGDLVFIIFGYNQLWGHLFVHCTTKKCLLQVKNVGSTPLTAFMTESSQSIFFPMTRKNQNKNLNNYQPYMAWPYRDWAILKAKETKKCRHRDDDDLAEFCQFITYSYSTYRSPQFTAAARFGIANK